MTSPLLQPFESTTADPFDALKSAHLLNRAAFGATPAEIAHFQKLGPIKATEALLSFPNQPATDQSPDDFPSLASLDPYPNEMRGVARMFAGKSQADQAAEFMKFQQANRQALVSIGEWWLKRMAAAEYPLQEKLTLFWHGHFTTSAGDERLTKLMWRQNETLRQNAAGNFGALAKAIARDPAMLDYLNNQQNSRKHPNENFARELMELFTLGVGHYTEADVKEAARAFTGWGHNGAEFVFRRFDHDDGPKTFLGKTGPFDGDDIIDILLDQPHCALHIAGRLARFFISDDPTHELIAALADLLRANRYQLRPTLQTLLTSRAFYDPQSIGSQIKSPIQLVIGTSRLLSVDLPPGRILFNNASPLMQLGQVPFFPPNVKGWPGGRTWINTSTLLIRYNTCVRFAAESKPEKAESPEAAVDTWVARLIQRPITPDQRRLLLDSLGTNTDPDSIRQMIQLIVSMPEYQLC